MAGHATQSPHHATSDTSRPGPQLAPTPVALSARRAERWLDLPPGAWQKRRLFALRVAADRFESLGVRSGDFVIVEPGARERPGQLVVTRQTGTLSIKRLPTAIPAGRLPSVLELPFRRSPSKDAARVVGTVLGVIRPTGTGALKPIRTTSSGSHRKCGSTSLSETQDAQPHALDLTGNDSKAARLQRILEASQPVTRITEGSRVCRDFSERWRARLSTLLLCQARAHDPRIRAALLDEAASAARHLRPGRERRHSIH